MKQENLILKQILEEFKRRVFEESIQRIKLCLGMVSESMVWYRHNEQVNSIGNNILHLEGNAKQWILSGIGNWPDNRNRQLEFVPNQSYNKQALIEKLDKLQLNLNEVLEKIEIEKLTEKRKVQVFQETGMSILIHVIEHFSYHTGQITLLTKILTGEPTHYYGNLNLDIYE